MAALSQFDSAKYERQVGNLSSQLAHLHELLGLPVDAWRWRMRALRINARSASVNQAYLVLLTTSVFLSRQGEWEVARAFTDGVAHSRFAGVGSLQRMLALVEQFQGSAE